jgi:glycosyltransferase involved in cell wall biosynthesis
MFKPINKTDARQKLGFPTDKKIILFGAANVNDSRKGFLYLKLALSQLHKITDNEKIMAVIFGKNAKKITKKIDFPVIPLDYVSNTETLINLYNAADVFVLPSLEDNLPNTVMESLACGTPVAAFSTGGITDMITHQHNGYLAVLRDSNDLSKGIKFLIENSQNIDFAANARKKVETCFTPDIVANKYKTLYENILK